MNNPFAPPPDSQSTVPETDAGSPRSVLGIFCSSVLALVYALVLAIEEIAVPDEELFIAGMRDKLVEYVLSDEYVELARTGLVDSGVREDGSIVSEGP